MYKVGDVVWYASFEQRKEKVPCPVCYGNKSVIVVLGNGDEVQVECGFCNRGYNPPSGYVTEYVQLPRAEQMTITRRSIEEGSGGEKVEYASTHYGLYPERMFDTYEEALACADEMAEQDKIKKENNPKYKNEKSYSWNAGYHMKSAEKCRKEVIYHEEKAKICKSHSKTKGE